MAIKDLLKIRAEKKSKKPNFVRQDVGYKKEVGSKYRRPKGYHSKMRLSLKGSEPLPSAGYRAPAKVRGLNPSGLNDILIFSVKDLSKITKADCVVIGSSVGLRSKIPILEKVIELKLNCNSDAKKTLDASKEKFETLKKARADKNAKRAKVEDKSKKSSKKESKVKDEKESKDSDTESDKTKKAKEAEKVLINKEKAI